MRRYWQWICAGLPIGLISLCALLAVIRWTVQDAWHSTALPYYAARPIVLAALLFFALVVAFRTRRRKTAVIAGCAGLVMVVIWAAESFSYRGPLSETATHRAVEWNVMSGRFGWDSIFEKLREIDADVIILVEAFNESNERDAIRERILPDYHATAEQSGLMILSRTELTDVSFERIGRGSHCVLVNIVIDNEPINVIAVDVESDPRRFRKYPLEDLAMVVKRFADEPLIVAGDLNTPPDSVHFAPLRAALRNGFETVGDGYAPTWPSLAPVIALDQFWVNEKIDARRLEGGWTVHSDHRPVILEFGF